MTRTKGWASYQRWTVEFSTLRGAFDSLRRRSSTLSNAERSVTLMPPPEKGILSKMPILRAVLMAAFWAVWMMKAVSAHFQQLFLAFSIHTIIIHEWLENTSSPLALWLRLQVSRHLWRELDDQSYSIQSPHSSTCLRLCLLLGRVPIHLRCRWAFWGMVCQSNRVWTLARE